jgi:ankyrin repeat protein
LVKRLIAASANISHANRNGTTALMVAAQYGYPESMRALLEAGAQPNLRDRRGDDAKDYANRFARQVRLSGERGEPTREEYEKRLQEVLAILAATP